jgi:hypothetical protein
LDEAQRQQSFPAFRTPAQPSRNTTAIHCKKGKHPMNNKYLIPGRDDSLLEWAKGFYAYALANYGNWRAPSPQLTLEAPLAAFEAAYAKCQSPNHGKVDVLEKDKARKILEKAYSDYCKANILSNPQITDTQRESMGFISNKRRFINVLLCVISAVICYILLTLLKLYIMK